MYRYIFIILIIASCTKDNLEESFPCGSENVFYQDQDPSQSIARIIETKCLGCHTKGNTISFLALETYEEVSTSLTMDIINRVITPMPPSSSVPLSDCEKIKIENWINNGFIYEAEQR